MGLVDAAVHPEMLFSPWLLSTKELVVGTGDGGGACTLFVKLVRVHRPSSTTASRLFFL